VTSELITQFNKGEKTKKGGGGVKIFINLGHWVLPLREGKILKGAGGEENLLEEHPRKEKRVF